MLSLFRHPLRSSESLDVVPDSGSWERLRRARALSASEIASWRRLLRWESSQVRARALPPLRRAKRVLRRLGLHHLFHEVRTFLETEEEALLDALFAQMESFLDRAARERSDRGENSRVREVIASLQRRLRIKSHRLHQLPCTPETTVNRALLIREYVREESRLLCLGDDDFVSVALAFLIPNEITVCDLDPQVLRLIEAIATEQGLHISCRRVDVRRPLPKDLIGAYDIVITDPIYLMREMVLFLSAAHGCLRRAPSSYLFCGGSRSLAGRSWEQLQQWATAHQLVLHALLPGFNEYPKTRRLHVFLTLAERLLLRAPVTRACARLPSLYSDYLIFRFRAEDLESS